MGFFSIFKNKKNKNNSSSALIKAKKYQLGMEKTRSGLLNKIKGLFSNYNQLTDDFFDDLTDIFIMADIGVETTLDFIEELKKDERIKDVEDEKILQELIVDKMFELYLQNEIVDTSLNLEDGTLNVILMVGVNGVGKTTSIAKLAHMLKNEGKKVMLVAGDTFRAGAISQLQIWGERIGVEVVAKTESSDPASVIFEGIKQAKEKNIDVLICDTAGRLQNKTNLMQELQKISRVIEKEAPNGLKETLLVIDATTGQNGLSQALAFKEVTNITGVILTKLDGTSKGGIVLAIRDKYGLPIKFVGLGEGMDDLEYFDLENYIYGLFGDSDE